MSDRRIVIPLGCVGFLVREGQTVVPQGLAGELVSSAEAPECGSPGQAYQLLLDMASLRKEHFRAIYLDARQRMLRQETVSIGSLTATIVHPREVYRPAIELSAAGVLVAHNHPSGDPNPSPEDLALTRRLRQAGEILGIELIDHLIIGRCGYVSLKERGEL